MRVCGGKFRTQHPRKMLVIQDAIALLASCRTRSCVRDFVTHLAEVKVNGWAGLRLPARDDCRTLLKRGGDGGGGGEGCFVCRWGEGKGGKRSQQEPAVVSVDLGPLCSGRLDLHKDFLSCTREMNLRARSASAGAPWRAPGRCQRYGSTSPQTSRVVA